MVDAAVQPGSHGLSGFLTASEMATVRHVCSHPAEHQPLDTEQAASVGKLDVQVARERAQCLREISRQRPAGQESVLLARRGAGTPIGLSPGLDLPVLTANTRLQPQPSRQTQSVLRNRSLFAERHLGRHPSQNTPRLSPFA